MRTAKQVKGFSILFISLLFITRCSIIRHSSIPEESRPGIAIIHIPLEAFAGKRFVWAVMANEKTEYVEVYIRYIINDNIGLYDQVDMIGPVSVKENKWIRHINVFYRPGIYRFVIRAGNEHGVIEKKEEMIVY